MRLLHYVRNDNDLRIFYQQYEKSLNCTQININPFYSRSERFPYLSYIN